MKARTSCAVFAFGAVIAATVGLTAIPARADTLTTITPSPTCNGNTGPWVVTVIANSSVGQHPETLPGTVICAYGESTAVFPNGTQESFAIGTSHAVWTAWNSSQGGTSWAEESMGGNAISGVTILQGEQDGWFLRIKAQGDGGPTYCNDRGAEGSANSASGWSGWYEC